MITEEQYREAVAICQAYEDQQRRENEPDDEEDYNDDPEECDVCGRQNCICDDVADCTCGAWKYVPAKGYFRVADCICGRG